MCVDDKHSVVNGAIEKESRPNSPYHEEFFIIKIKPQNQKFFFVLKEINKKIKKELKWNKIFIISLVYNQINKSVP